MNNRLHLLFVALLIIVSFLQSPAENKKKYTAEERQLILDLYDIGVLQFENDSKPEQSPYRTHFRNTMSYPHLFKRIVLLTRSRAATLSFDAICGVPDAAVPLAADVAYKMRAPLVMKQTRKEEYLPGKSLVGAVRPTMQCLVIEDVVTTAKNITGTIKAVEEQGLVVSDCLILFDRERGGVELLKQNGYKPHVIFNITDFMNVLQEEGKIDESIANRIIEWTRANQIQALPS